MLTIARAVVIGMLIMLVGTMPRNIAFALNLRFWNVVPWAVPLIAAWMWMFWNYLGGKLFANATSDARRENLRARSLSTRTWALSLAYGGFGIVALVFALRLVNRFVALPAQTLPDLSHVPRLTVFSLLLAAAPVAGIVEESAFRGYMLGPIERRHGLTVAILITGVLFAVAHLDFILILLPYYVAVAALYGVVTHRTNSILPAVVLHTAGNTYSNLDLLLTGHAEWQSESRSLMINTGLDAEFWLALGACLLSLVAMFWFLKQLPLPDRKTAF